MTRETLNKANMLEDKIECIKCEKEKLLMVHKEIIINDEKEIIIFANEFNCSISSVKNLIGFKSVLVAFLEKTISICDESIKIYEKELEEL